MTSLLISVASLQRLSTRDTQTVRLDGSVQERGSMPFVADHLQSKAESRQRCSSALKPTCASRLHPFRQHYSLQRMIVVMMLLEVGRAEIPSRCVLSQPGPVLSHTPRSGTSLTCYRRLKQGQVLPSTHPKDPKAYERQVDPVTLSSPTDWQTDTTGSSLRYFSQLLRTLELIRANERR